MILMIAGINMMTTAAIIATQANRLDHRSTAKKKRSTCLKRAVLMMRLLDVDCWITYFFCLVNNYFAL